MRYSWHQKEVPRRVQEASWTAWRGRRGRLGGPRQLSESSECARKGLAQSASSPQSLKRYACAFRSNVTPVYVLVIGIVFFPNKALP